MLEPSPQHQVPDADPSGIYHFHDGEFIFFLGSLLYAYGFVPQSHLINTLPTLQTL